MNVEDRHSFPQSATPSNQPSNISLNVNRTRKDYYETR